METKSEVYHIYFNPEIRLVIMKWDDYSASEQFKQGFELMLNT
jgi:hypothetical protein